MPLVKINMIKGKDTKYKKKVLDSVHNGLMSSLGIDDWDRFQRIIEIPREDFEIPPEKTDNFLIIELTIFPGRTKEQKKKAIENITKELVDNLEIAKTDVFIVIYDPPMENWGLGGSQME